MRIMWPGVHVVHTLINLQAVWRMNKVKLWKTCLRTEIVWVYFAKRMYKMPDLALAPPFVTMTTYRNIVEVVFPKERPEMLWLLSKQLDLFVTSALIGSLECQHYWNIYWSSLNYVWLLVCGDWRSDTWLAKKRILIHNKCQQFSKLIIIQWFYCTYQHRRFYSSGS
jgi:hypothetical protein